MNKTGRNTSCPCGSGKKYKKCCAASGPKNSRTPGVLVEMYDIEEKKRYVVTDNMLENQIKTMAPKIAESFDLHFTDDLQAISQEISRASSIIFIAIQGGALKMPWRSVCMQILQNAISTVVAAAAILRMGHRLQPGILIRNVFESISVILAMIQDVKYYDLYKQEKLDSPATLKIAKKAYPFIGEVYGRFSEDFAHIGSLHGAIQQLSVFTKDEEAVKVNIMFLRMTANLLYITTELLLFDYVLKPRYWERIDRGQYRYNPSDEERRRQSLFLLEKTPEDAKANDSTKK